MTWNLFIDDERNPHNVFWADSKILSRYHEEDWVICRNHYEVFDRVFELGMPSYISFDHDLGEDNWTGYDIVKELVDIDMNTIDTNYMFPKDFDFFVHSQNPIGKKNIESYLNRYLSVRDKL